MTPQDYIDAHHDELLDRLIEFVSIPSVSTDPAYADGIERAAKWVASQMQLAGIEPRIIETDGHPMVVGEWMGAGTHAPTVLIYGHYDVQPPDPLDKWTTEPFNPTVRDGRLYGRGVSDDKGPVLIPLVVLEAFLKTRGALPVNVRFTIEGEEEIGSPSFEPLMRRRPELFKADFVLSADGAMWRINEPSITVASRGMTGLEIRVQGAGKDLHSGRHGGAVANPLHVLARLIGGLHTPDGTVAVDGFYDEVRPLSDVERDAIRKLDYDEIEYFKAIGAPEGFGEPGFTPLEQQWARPTLEVNGMWGGYQGPGSKSVIPSEAFAKITCRLVPHQDPDDVRDLVERHLIKHCPPGVTLDITKDKHGAYPYAIPEDHTGIKVAQQALKLVYGQDPVVVRMGGTLPIASAFKQLFDMDNVSFV